MPHLKNKKIKQANLIGIILPTVGLMSSNKPASKESSIDFHLEMIEKIDRLLEKHEKKTLSEQLITEQTSNFPEEPSVEIREDLGKKIELYEVELGKKTDDIFTKERPMPEEFKTDLPITNNPDFRFVSSLDFPDTVLQVKETGKERVEIINLTSMRATPKKSILWLNRNQTSKNGNNSKSNFNNKKVEIIDAKKFRNKKIDKLYAVSTKKSEKKEEKGGIYYLDSSKQKKEGKINNSEKKHSYIPIDFEEKLKELKEAEQEKIESDQKMSEKEKKKLKKLEARKARMEEREKRREAKKALKEKKKKSGKNIETKADEQPKETEELLDEDIKKILLITDNLLGELPDEVIDSFIKSEDFELYEKVLSKYKIK